MIYKLDIGYNGNYDDLKTILSFDTVRSVYTGGVKGDLSGGRLQFIDSLESIKEQIVYAHSKDVCFNLAINSPCNIKNRDEIEWWNDLIDYLKEIENTGVDGVIVSHPLIMETVKKHTGLKLIVSTICEISTARSARYYEELGADILIPSMNVNYHLDRLAEIKHALTYTRIRIMVNEHCLPDCPWRMAHHNHIAHQGHNMDYLANCIKIYLKDPYKLLLNNTIRPEDLDHYRGIADDFKIVARTMSIEKLYPVIKAYHERKYKGNFLDFYGELFPRFFTIDNSKLDKLAHQKFKCSKFCQECDYCRKMCENLIEYDSRLLKQAKLPV